MKIDLKGDFKSRRVWLNGEELLPYESQKVTNHSPDGFAWGYGGSGPSQLSLAIMIKLFGKPYDYHRFKWEHIATLPEESFHKTIEFTPIDYGVRTS